MCLFDLQEIVIDVIAASFVDPLADGRGTGEVERRSRYWLQCPNANEVLV